MSTVVRDLVKGKGELQCIEKRADAEVPQPHETPAGSSKCRKTTIMEDKRACVDAIYEELKSKHGGKYSRPQCRLWAETIDVGSHMQARRSLPLVPSSTM